MSTAIWPVSPLSDVTHTVEIAWGADLTDVDGSGWSWTDITSDVRMRPGIHISRGRGDETSRSQPAELTLELDNSSSDYSLGGHSANYPFVRRGTPIRYLIDPDDGGGNRTAFFGFADGFTPHWDAKGRIPVVTLTASGALRRLQQGQQPVKSSYRRSIVENSSVVAYWPMEEGRGAQYAAPVFGGQFMIPDTPNSVNWGTSSDFLSSEPLPDVNDSGLIAVVNPYTATGEGSVKFFLFVPDDGLTNGSVLAYIYTTGSLYRWDIVYGTGGTLQLFIYNSDHTLNSSSGVIGFGVDGQLLRIEINFEEDSGDVNWGIFTLSATPGSTAGGITDTVSGETFGIISQIELAPLNQCAGTVMGHLTVHNTDQGQDFSDSEFWAWQINAGSTTNPELPQSGTATNSRLTRLCSENMMQLTRHVGTGSIGTRVEGMGPQLIKTFVELLYEIEDCDQGQLFDGEAPGLTYTSRRYREDGSVILTLDASSDDLCEPFVPVDDDQRTRNKVTAKRLFGVQDTYENIVGPSGTNVIGIYDSDFEFNGFNDIMVIQHAAFQVALGTEPGYRYPEVTVDLLAVPSFAADAVDAVCGDVIVVTNADEVLEAFPLGDIWLMIEGIGHSIDESGWKFIARCSSAEPWIVAQVSAETGDTNPYVMRADADSSTVNTNASQGATSLSVATAAGFPLWTTNSDNYPLTLDVGGIPVNATACSGTSSPQTFTVSALPLARTAGMEVKLWNPRPLGLGSSTSSV